MEAGGDVCIPSDNNLRVRLSGKRRRERVGRAEVGHQPSARSEASIERAVGGIAVERDLVPTRRCAQAGGDNLSVWLRREGVSDIDARR